MGITKVQTRSLVDFAGYCDQCHESLAPYTPARDLDFKCALTTFGGSGGGGGFRSVEDGRASGYPEIVYRSTPMSPGEWEDATGKKLDDRYDPTRPIDPPKDPEDIHAMRTKGPNWHDFYAAGGEREGGAWMEATGGDAPWAKPLKKTWDAAVDDRLWEADVVRKELRFLIRVLIKVAERYPEVDLENSKMMKKYVDGV
ncbi:MAG: hypothetical protein ACRDTU_22290 [Micromonosporaceae bacterium]